MERQPEHRQRVVCVEPRALAFAPAKGEEIDEAKEKELLDELTERYTKQTSPYYAAARIWTDAVIEPTDTRQWISMGIEAANHAPIEKPFNLGVIQT